MSWRNWGQRAFLVATMAVSGCLSVQTQTSLDGSQDDGGKPFVEAFIEYPGPQAKWAGPTTLVLHVSAKDQGLAQITLTPAGFSLPPMKRNDDVNVVHRTPASGQSVSSQVARDQLKQLAQDLDKPEPEFRGCLTPVRARLIRSDGALTEKEGCRSQMGWPRAVSEWSNQMISAAVYSQ